MKKVLIASILLLFPLGCQSIDQVRTDSEQNSEDPCAEKSCAPGYICNDGVCEIIKRAGTIDELGMNCDPECGLTESCIDNVCVENHVSSLCEGKKCPEGWVCDDRGCREKRGCEITSCTPDHRCHKGDCIPVDSCIFNECPPDQTCKDHICQPVP